MGGIAISMLCVRHCAQKPVSPVGKDSASSYIRCVSLPNVTGPAGAPTVTKTYAVNIFTGIVITVPAALSVV